MKIDGLFAAKPQPFGPRGALSSIVKTAVPVLTVTFDGTEQDEQGNKKLHGGPEKVLHQYPVSNYQQLAKAFPDAAAQLVVGAIGENLSISGMEDTEVQIGDIYQMGSTVVQVSAPRAPCNKISHRFGQKNMDRYIAVNGLTGWYYRVIETGQVALGDPVILQHRENLTVSVRDLVKAVFAEDITREQLEHIATLPPLDDEWREKCLRRANRQAAK